MSDLLIALAYGLGGLWIARWTFRAIVEDWGMRVDWVDVTCFAFVALLIGVMWPPVAAFLLLRAAVGERDPQAFVRKVAGESRNARLARQAEEIRAHEHKIAQLERELRIGVDR